MSAEPLPYDGDDDSPWEVDVRPVAPAPDGWPVMHSDAYHGIAGEIVDTIKPHSEADPAALLANVLIHTSALLGNLPYAVADGTRHPGRLFGVNVGETSKARKTTATANVRNFAQEHDKEFFRNNVASGFGSGESFVDFAAGRVEAGDGRVFVSEPEFANVLTVCGRESSTLSSVIRNAWDGGLLSARSRAKTAVADGAAVVMVGQITVEELRSRLRTLDIANGLANRILFFLSRRSQLLPAGGALTEEAVKAQGLVWSLAIDRARGSGAYEGQGLRRLSRTRAAERVWADLYGVMADDDPGGILGAVTARAEAHVLRLSVVYAALDGSARIDLTHLRAAWAVWSYCRASAEFIFGSAPGDTLTDRILSLARKAGDNGLTVTDLHRALGNNWTSERRASALGTLEDAGLVEVKEVQPPKGRPARWVYAIEQERKVSALPTFDDLLRKSRPE